MLKLKNLSKYINIVSKTFFFHAISRTNLFSGKNHAPRYVSGSLCRLIIKYINHYHDYSCIVALIIYFQLNERNIYIAYNYDQHDNVFSWKGKQQ